ncbi:hypothetical protein [Allosphingosinicella deserti]|uniref:Uncharacterized protein n=1 Tax=Allosphingosinicella deserti TaxID=2116704 RepID=A0A2P7QFP9_9SPHN|nr:hypothetical protein [Sphingomonas deserti]PSJ36808.1 hypothetical protein C7I55_24145 [Sphingomonas deserti]
MVDVQTIEKNFYPVVVSERLARGADELESRTIYTYFLLPDEKGEPVPFLISDDHIDDRFARQVLETAAGRRPEGLEKIPLGENRYGLTHLILAAPQYHSALNGRSGLDRSATVLVVPIFEPELSGTETIEDFHTLRRHIIPDERWDRTIQPKVQLRYHNGKTEGGTGNGYALVTFQTAMFEVGNLMGVEDGFVEIINHKGDVIEILFAHDEMYTVISDRDDSTGVLASFDEAGDAIWAMLNASAG